MKEYDSKNVGRVLHVHNSEAVQSSQHGGKSGDDWDDIQILINFGHE